MPLKPHFIEDVPYVYLPFIKDVIDMTQPSQVIDADVTFALDGQWQTSWGSKTDFWKYFVTHYGHYRILREYCEEVNDELVCDYIDFNKGAYPVLIGNQEKYNRLAESLKKNYDVLKPYNIEEEHSTAADSSKTNQYYAMHTDTNKESSMDNTQLYDSSSTNYGSHTDYVDREHDRSVTFKDNAFETNRAEIEHAKDSRIGNIGNHSYAELIEKEIKLARYNFWDIICRDLLDNICLKFFMSC